MKTKIFSILIFTFMGFLSMRVQAQIGLWGQFGNNIYSTNIGGNVGVGTLVPSERLTVIGNAWIDGGLIAGPTSIGAWPVDNNYAYFAANTLDQDASINYALLQRRDNGATFLNSPHSLHFRLRDEDFMVMDSLGNLDLSALLNTTIRPAGDLILKPGDDMVVDVRDDVFFRSGGSNRMSIASSGNVSVYNSLEVNKNLHTTGYTRIGKNSTYPYLFGELKHSGGSGGFQINANARGGWADLHLQTDGTTRLFVESRGNVGIGTTNVTHKFNVNGSAAKPGGGSWSTYSDKRLKKNIKDFKYGLDVLSKVRPVTYHYNGKLEMDSKVEHIGVIAQELQKVAPFMVEEVATETEGKKSGTYLSVDPSAFDYILINSVQEQQEMIADLKRTNETLQDENEAIRAELAELKGLVDKLIQNPSKVKKRMESVSSANLLQNHPNPFNSTTDIQYFIPENTKSALLQITDAAGKIVKRIIIDHKGDGQITLEASGLSAGTYQYSLMLDGRLSATKQMVLTSF